METEYKNDFEKFLAHTDEKEVLLKEIVREIKKHNAHSLLDIGAGNGLLAIPLSKNIDRYVGVEPKQTFIKILKNANLDILEASFPVSISEQFDLVLSSHSLSYETHGFAPFIQAAFNLVTPGGALLIITYRGEEDEWNELCTLLGEPQIDYTRLRFAALTKQVTELGSTTIRKVMTKVRTTNLGDMIGALSFVFSDGDPQRKEIFFGHAPKLRELLESKYKEEAGYFFPFQHFFYFNFAKEQVK